MKAITITLNHRTVTALAALGTTLRDFLRAQGCFSVRFGSDDGATGAATVLLDGTPISGDVVLAEQADGHEVFTLEGLEGPNGELHPIQQAFVDHSGFQCGFCTSGQIMTAKALLERTPSPTEDQVRAAMAGNMCRCSAYKRILESVMAASRQMRA